MSYAVMLDINRGENRCSGVIISRHHILTAAHCFVKESQCLTGPELRNGTLSSATELPVEVHYGGTCVLLKEGGACSPSEVMNRVNASHIGVPRRYFTSKCHSGDIAVVEMEKPLPSAATNFNYACLPSLTTKLQQKIAMAGFGRNPRGRSIREKHLEWISLLRERFCDPSLYVGKDVFCLRGEQQFPCEGDSGGGVMQRANSKMSFVMGVLSKGLSCEDVWLALERSSDNQLAQFRGTVVTDTRKYLDWLCLHTGICELHINRKTIKKEKIVMVY